VLIEAGPRVLPAYVPELSEKARLRLVKMGVEVLLDTRVVGVDANGVDLDANGKMSRIDARTLVWGAGVAASPIAKSLGVPLDKAGRVAVDPDLSVPGAPNVFVVGDLAAVHDKKGAWVPGVAPAAQQEGRHAVKMILADLEKKPRAPFRYLDKGSLATIGRAAAVAEVGRLHTEGFFAWCLWLVVHIATLIGFRNRLLVLAQWAFAYLRFERGARLITGGIPPLRSSGKVLGTPNIGTPTNSASPVL
jgi:NADH dehydrogenase